MKIARWILTGAAAACIAGLIGFTTYGPGKLFVFRLSGSLWCDIFLVAALALLVALCVMTLIQRSRDGGKRLLLWIGTFLFLIPLLFSLLPVMDDIKRFGTLQEMKSPDGKHTLYYLEMADESTGVSCKVCYRREGLVTYEKLFIMDPAREIMLQWGDTWFMYRTTTYEYSDYDE